MAYSILIVDDESHARERLVKYLKDDNDIEIIGECDNGTDAVNFIKKNDVDLVFLDIQMPEMDGFGVIESLGLKNLPIIIFVTAYDRFAVNAFKVNALDYVLKPVSKKRLDESLDRAKERLASKKSGEINNNIVQLLEGLNQEKQHLERIVVKTNDKMYLIKTDEIDWIEADDNYVKLHTGEKAHLLRQTMKNMEETLDPNIFLRIHRSVIVNMDRIKEIQQWFNNEYTVILKDGTELTMSRGYRDKAKELFKNFL